MNNSVEQENSTKVSEIFDSLNNEDDDKNLGNFLNFNYVSHFLYFRKKK